MKDLVRLARYTRGKGNGIAIIDSGLEATHQCLISGPADGIHIHKSEQGTLLYDQHLEDKNGHGTAVAGLIHIIHPQAPLYIVKLSSFDEVITEDMLIEGLMWCMKKDEIGIINISMGIKSRFYSDKLFTTCRDAYRKKKLIVAAVHSNPYHECYPAYFPFVLGVCSGFAPKAAFRWLRWGAGVNIIAGGNFQKVLWKGNDYRILSGTSLACARFTAALSKLTGSTAFNTGKNNLKDLLSSGSNDLIIPLKYFRSDRSLPNSIGYIKNYKEAAQILQHRKIILYPASDPEITYLHRCWFPLLQGRLHLKDHSCNELQPLPVIKRSQPDLPADNLIVIGGGVADWADDKIVSLHKLIKKALTQQADLLLLNSLLLNMVVEYIQAHFKNYTGRIYTSVPRKRVRHAGTSIFKPIAKKIALIGINIHPGLLLDAEKKLRDILRKRGAPAYTITTDDYLYFLGADSLLSDPIPLAASEKSGYGILMINEKIESHYRMNHQIQLRALHTKLAGFDPDNIVVVTDSDVEKDDLKAVLDLFCRAMPERSLFVGYWSNKRPHITKNFQLSMTQAERMVPVLNLDDNRNWQLIDGLIT